ncbi:MAG: hypothetical protein P8179_20885, partial [Candidatus Thiodiazotropha sp.]
ERLEETIEKLNQQLDTTRTEAKQQLNEVQQQAQADYKQLEEKMNLAMDQALELEKQRAKAEQTRFESEKDALNQQLEATRIEADQQLHDAQQQAQIGSQMLQGRMNQALETEKQNSRQAQKRLNAAVEALNKQLKEAHTETARQLKEERQKTQADSVKLQEQMNQAIEAEKKSAQKELKQLKGEIKRLNEQMDNEKQQMEAEYQLETQQLKQSLETEKQHAKDEQIRLEETIDKLNEQLKAIRAEACKQREKRINQETLLQKEYSTIKGLNKLLQTTKSALAINRKQTAEAQKSLSELQQNFESNELAKAEATKSKDALLAAKLEFDALKNKLEEENFNLRSQLDHQQQSIEEFSSENGRLQKLLSDSKAKEKIENPGSNLSVSEQMSLLETKAQLEDQLSKLEIKLSELTATANEERQEKDSLLQQLKIAKAQTKDSDEIERIKDENTALKRKVEGLREVQIEMERQLSKGAGTDSETKKLHASLVAAEAKLKTAEKFIHENQALIRENQIHESAINILDEELDALTKERESLLKAQNKLNTELDKNQQYTSKLVDENDRLQIELRNCQDKLQEIN